MTEVIHIACKLLHTLKAQSPISSCQHRRTIASEQSLMGTMTRSLYGSRPLLAPMPLGYICIYPGWGLRIGLARIRVSANRWTTRQGVSPLPHATGDVSGGIWRRVCVARSTAVDRPVAHRFCCNCQILFFVVTPLMRFLGEASGRGLIITCGDLAFAAVFAWWLFSSRQLV